MYSNYIILPLFRKAFYVLTIFLFRKAFDVSFALEINGKNP